MKIMSNKTNKKNGVVVEWPEGHFTIDDAWQKAGGEKVIPNITLRFRVNKAEADKEIVLIGKIKPAIGRPKKVFAKANPSKELLEAARAAGVLPLNEAKATVTVAEVKAEKKVTQVVSTVTPDTAKTESAVAATK